MLYQKKIIPFHRIGFCVMLQHYAISLLFCSHGIAQRTLLTSTSMSLLHVPDEHTHAHIDIRLVLVEIILFVLIVPSK
jgi:hypothetical protein